MSSSLSNPKARSHRTARYAMLAPAAAISLLAACSSSSSSAASSPSATTPAASSPSSSSPATGTSGAAGGATTVIATETEFHIALSRTAFSPGTYTFTVEDKGQATHNLVITGPGVNHAKTPALLSPGQSGSVTVTLQKGTYDIYCGVPGHKARGMDVHITVS